MEWCPSVYLGAVSRSVCDEVGPTVFQLTAKKANTRSERCNKTSRANTTHILFRGCVDWDFKYTLSDVDYLVDGAAAQCGRRWGRLQADERARCNKRGILFYFILFQWAKKPAKKHCKRQKEERNIYNKEKIQKNTERLRKNTKKLRKDRHK